jgi:hypothetical protein
VTLLDDYRAAVAGRGVHRVYKINDVPPSPVYPYAVVSVGVPDKVSRTLNGSASDLNRGVTQFFDRDIDGVLDLAAIGDLDGTYLNGRLLTREVSSPPFRDPDDQGVLAVTTTYQF